MKEIAYKLVHTFYAYIAACAVATLIHGLIIFLIHLLLTPPKNEELISLYTGSDGTHLFTIILITGLFLLKYTKKLNIVKSTKT